MKTAERVGRVENMRLSIPEWNESDRPREKYLAQGGSGVSDAELIAILLRSGTREDSALDLSKRLLSSCRNSLNQLSEMSVSDLTRIRGIGQVKAVTLCAAFELGRRRRTEDVRLQKRITSSDDIVELMQCHIADLSHEEFWAVYVNQNNVILKEYKIGQGGLTSTQADIRLIVKNAIEVNATGMFLAHNHPSGNVSPSAEDIALTNQVKQAAAICNIQLRDHVIVSGNMGYSFYEAALL